MEDRSGASPIHDGGDLPVTGTPSRGLDATGRGRQLFNPVERDQAAIYDAVSGSGRRGRKAERFEAKAGRGGHLAAAVLGACDWQ